MVAVVFMYMPSILVTQSAPCKPRSPLGRIWSYTRNEFVIRVANDQFEEASPFGHSLRLFDGRPLFFAAGTKLCPDPDHFAWHRDKRFGAISGSGEAP